MTRMRNATHLYLPVVLLAALVAAGCDLFDHNDGAVDIDPAESTFMVMIPLPDQPARGEFFDVAVRIFNARNVVSTPFKLLFDHRILEFERSGSFLGPFLQSGGNNVFFQSSVGGELENQVWVALSILGAPANGGADGNGDLCTLRFRVLQDTTAASFSIIPFENRIFGPGLAEQPVSFLYLTRPLP